MVEWWTVAKLARELGEARTTLASAVDAGHVESTILGCGTRVVRLESAKRWAKTERKRGRKAAIKDRTASRTEIEPAPHPADGTPNVISLFGCRTFSTCVTGAMMI